MQLDPAQDPIPLDFAADIGLVGLGAVALDLVANLRDHGFAVVALDDGSEATRDARAAGIRLEPGLAELVTRVARPRRLLFMLGDGAEIDRKLGDLLPWLDPGDVVIDGGASHYKDTIRRALMIERRSFGFLGLGLCCGPRLARHGPAMIAGGGSEAWDTAAHILERIAAKGGEGPSATHLGPNGAGHFVNTVHDALEQALGGLVNESALMLDALAGLAQGRIAPFLDDRLGADQRAATFIAQASSPFKASPTAGWAVGAALETGIATPVLAAGHFRSTGPLEMGGQRQPGTSALDPDNLKISLDLGQFCLFLEGQRLIEAVSAAQEWQIETVPVFRTWQTGSGLETVFLDFFTDALAQHGSRVTTDPALVKLVRQGIASLRTTIATAAAHNLAIPIHAASLAALESWLHKD